MRSNDWNVSHRPKRSKRLDPKPTEQLNVRRHNDESKLNKRRPTNGSNDVKTQLGYVLAVRKPSPNANSESRQSDDTTKPRHNVWHTSARRKRIQRRSANNVSAHTELPKRLHGKKPMH